MPGQGFIVQHIRRTFGQISIYDPATRRWKQANGAKLRRYMRTKFPQLHYRIKDYWEIFPVDATGTAPDGDMFQMIAFAPPRTRDYLNTSRGTFTQTGTAYFVPSNEAEDVFAQRFGMRKKAIAPANRLYARRGPYDFPGEAGHQGLAVSPVPSVFTLRATWNTDRARNDPSTSTTITET